MSLVNRSVLLVSPEPPYLEWMRKHGDTEAADDAYEEMRRDPAAYLLPEIEDEQEFPELLENCWSLVFDHELSGWEENQQVWPQDRDLEMFKGWFVVRIASTVWEACAWPLTVDDEGEGEGEDRGDGEGDGEGDGDWKEAT